MPRGLGGDDPPIGTHEAIVLQKATCEACREITREFEEDCLIKNFGLTRYREGLRRKDRLRHTLPVRHNGKNIEAQISDLPAFIAIPVIGHATVYDGNYQGGMPGGDIRFVKTHGPAGTNLTQGTTMTEFRVSFNRTSFFQLLAKIAHGMTICAYGIDGFTPTLQGLIRGTNPNFATWIGSNPETRDEEWGNGSLHKMQLERTMIRGVRYVLVWIRLFSSHQMTPTYYVISGILPPEPPAVAHSYRVAPR